MNNDGEKKQLWMEWRENVTYNQREFAREIKELREELPEQMKTALKEVVSPLHNETKEMRRIIIKHEGQIGTLNGKTGWKAKTWGILGGAFVVMLYVLFHSGVLKAFF